MFIKYRVFLSILLYDLPSDAIFIEAEVAQEQGAKAALALCDKCLKKAPRANILAAIKAYILMQLGKEQAGLELAQNVARMEPTERSVLEYLEKVFLFVNDCIHFFVSTCMQLTFESQIKPHVSYISKHLKKQRRRILAYFISFLS